MMDNIQAGNILSRFVLFMREKGESKCGKCHNGKKYQNGVFCSMYIADWHIRAAVSFRFSALDCMADMVLS